MKQIKRARVDSQGCTPWDPGLEAELPASLLPLETIHRADNVTSNLADVLELAHYTGMPPDELVVFRPERLALHELIVRLTADISEVEGEEEEDLGKNCRAIANRVMEYYIQPHMKEIVGAHAELRERVTRLVSQILAESLFKPPVVNQLETSLLFWRRLFDWKKSPRRTESIQEKTHRVIAGYKKKGLATEDPLHSAIFKSLYKVLGSIASTRGYIGSDSTLLIKLVTDRVSNLYGSKLIGEIIAPYVASAISAEGYAHYQIANRPIIISLKGASAAGKSSLRPMLRQMIDQLGIKPDGYITISPDIWRRLLLDYKSLGEAYKYAGRLTSHEVIAIDVKLDQYIRDKAHRDGSIPNLLVDRFRFDSFASEKIARILHGTYAKFADTMYLYFIVTPPEATVERGWERGLSRGRYKAVEDFLGHCVETYTGMPKLLFKWLAYEKPLLKYEFLDNSVPKGTYPKTIAYGSQAELNIVNVSAFLDIERYQKINIKAKSPEAVYPPGKTLDVEKNLEFLKQCLARIPLVNFLDQSTERVYVRVRRGVFEVVDESRFFVLQEDDTLVRVFREVAPSILRGV
ncbi:hypothetical protein GCM10011348_03180 [Marinobacterium nitratireducens]|uniref:Uncharacterized protein n=1 Tax=Marinobacterium nitratireducens TaxID=518897 RepID=A0A917Z745_9GAMM|nr:hypothetical protein [Marinobacterium nitratireducens]GGO76302.1 hypothetical protein GCM10011348_03180 [Marinobacterium nitratireducens]